MICHVCKKDRKKFSMGQCKKCYQHAIYLVKKEREAYLKTIPAEELLKIVRERKW